MTRTIWIMLATLGLAMAALVPLLHAGDAPPPVTAPAAAPAPAEPVKVAAPAPTPTVEPVKAPPAPTASAPAPAPTATAEPAVSSVVVRPASPKSREYRLQYEGTPYTEVIRRFCQISGKPILGDIAVEGTLTFIDSQPYTYDEMYDALNMFLAMKGYTLLETPRYFQITPLVGKYPNTLLSGEDDTSKVRPTEMVTMMLPLATLTADEAAKFVTPLVSTFGKIAPLPKGRGLLLTDRMENINRIRRLLKELDQGPPGTVAGERQLRSFRLLHASAREMASIVTTLFGVGGPTVMEAYAAAMAKVEEAGGDSRVQPDFRGVLAAAGPDPVKATPDERTNTLFVVGPPDKLVMVEQVVKQLDDVAGQGGKGTEMQIFHLKKARAEDVANTIRQALPPSTPSTPTVASGGYRMPSIMVSAPSMQARIVADTTTNSIIASAPLDQMARIEELIKELDQGEGEIRGGVRIFHLKVADAQQIVGAVANAIRRVDGGGGQGRGNNASAQAAVSADSRTNCLLVAGTASDIQTAAAIIEELDKPFDEKNPPAREIHVIPLKAGDPRQVADAINRLLRDQTTGGRGATAPSIRVEGEPVTGSIMVSAAPGDWQQIKTVIDQFVEKGQTQIVPVTRLIPVQHAKAVEVADNLRQVFTNQSRNARPGERPPVPVIITANERSNMLLVSAVEDDQKNVADLVKMLDVATDEQKVDPVHIIHMKAGDAVKVADVVRNLQPPVAPRQTQRVFIQADPASNSVVIRAPEGEYKALADMVSSLDTAIGTSGGIKVFKLTVADAQQVAAALQPALRRDTGGGRQVNAAPPTVVTADSRTNSVIVSGPAQDIQTAATLIEELDKPLKDTESRGVYVVQLKAGDARQLADAMTKILNQPDTSGGRGKPATGGIRVEADQGTNSLLISAAPGDWPMVQKVLDQLKASVMQQVTPSVRLVALKYAKASDLANTLRQAYAGQTNRPRGPGQTLAVPVVIAASDQTNSLLISASEDDQKDIAQLVKTMDIEPPVEGANLTQVRTYRMGDSRAADVAQALNRLYQQQPQRGGAPNVPAEQPPRFDADASTNQLIVSATPAQFTQVEKLIKELSTGTILNRETQIFPLRVARADTVAATLQTMLSDTPARQGGRQPADTSATDIRVAAIADSNTVVVQGPKEKLALAADLVKNLDAETVDGGPSVTIVQLRNSQAGTLADAVNAALAGTVTASGRNPRGGAAGSDTSTRVIVTAEPNSNSLLVRGPAPDVMRVVEMIKQLDTTAVPGGIQVRVFPVKNGDPQTLATALGKFFQDMGRQQGRGQNQTPVPFSITADDRTKTLAVSTTTANFAVVEQLLKTMDQDVDATHQDVTYLWLENAQAKAVATQITDMFRERKGTDKPVVTADDLTNSLTVVGKPVDLVEIENLVSKIDEGEKDNSTRMRVIPLGSPINAAKMAEAIKGILTEMDTSAAATTDYTGAAMPAVPEVTPRKEPPAPPAATGGRGGGGGGTGGGGGGTGGGGGRGGRGGRGGGGGGMGGGGGGAFFQAPREGVSITVDPVSNSLIVTGRRQDVDYIESLIDQLKTGFADREAIFRIFPIKESDPVSVARTLDALFNPPRVVQMPQGGNNQNAPLPPLPPPVISVVADVRTKNVIVRAKPIDFDIIEPLIKELDKVAAIVSDVRIFQLKNTDAVEVASNLRDLFQMARQQQNQPQPQNQQNAQQQRAGQLRQLMEVRSAAGVTQVDVSTGVTITPNRQTNSVVVAAPSDAMEIIAKLVSEIDQSGNVTAPSIRFYPVKNGDVRTMVASLQDLFVTGAARRATAGAGAGGRGQGGQPQAVSTLETPLAITADEVGRLIIVSASADKQELIEKVIKEMDNAQAQGNAAIKIYHLKNADATTIAPAILAAVDSSSAAATGGGGRGVRGGAASAGSGQIRISADRSSNSLVVRAPAADHELIARLVDEMDSAPAVSVRLYPLKNAEVRTTVTALQDLFGSGARTGGGGGRGTAAAGATQAAVVITGDEAGHMIMVSASADKHELIAKVVKEMDDASSTDQMIVKTYVIKTGDAASIAAAILPVIDRSSPASGGGGRGGASAASTSQTRITSDRSSNTIVVRASAADHEKVAKLVAEMDTAIADQFPVRMIPVTNGDATTMAQTLSRMFVGQGAGATSSGRVGSAGTAGRPSTIIDADRDARMLLVRADDATFEKIKAMAEKLDTASPQGQVTTTPLPLKYTQAAAVAQALSQAFASPQGGGGARGTTPNADDRVTIVAEPLSNTLLVTASAKNLERVKGLLEKLDTEQTGGIKTELLVLAKAKAADLAPTLTKMAQAGQPGTGGRTTSQPSVAVSADAGSNSLVITGPQSDVEKVLKMARQVDEATLPSVGMTPFIIALKNSDATTMAQMVRDLYQQQSQAAQRERKTLDALAVSADVRANALVLSTSRDMYEQVSQWVDRIETMQPKRGALRILTVRDADPTEVNNAIKQLFPGGPGATGGTGSGTTTIRRGANGPLGVEGPAQGPAPGGGKVETTVLPQVKSLLIDASDEDFETIKKLAEMLDKAAQDNKRLTRVFPLKNVSNTRAATALNNTFRAVPGRTGQQAPEDTVTITALPDTNSLVVTATATKMEEVVRLLEQLDKPEVSQPVEVRIFPLKNTEPTKVMPLVQAALTPLKQARPDEPISIQPDERTRSLVVTARGPMFERIEQIIKTLDKPPEHPATDVVIIPLKRADATRLATVLTDMLKPSATGAVTPEAAALQQQIRLLRIHAGPGGDDIPELDLTKPIKISADPSAAGSQGSNALIITATPDNIKALRAVIGVLDAVPLAEGVRVRIVHLDNADAASVVTVLREIFTQGKQLAGRTGSSVAGKAEPETAAGRALVNTFDVSADVRTNTLVMSGIEESLALADLVVKDLDRETGVLVTEVRCFRLKYADPAKMLPVLQSVFAETANPVAGTEGLKTQVTRLQTILDKQEPRTTEVPKARAALTIQADATTSILVVAARKDVMPLIADIIQTMDIPGAGAMNTVRIYPLANADAQRLKTVFDGLYAQNAAPNVRPEDRPVVQVDIRTNSLVISTSEKTFTMIETLLKQFDAKVPVGQSPIQTITLKYTDAATLAPILQKMMDARVQRVTALGQADADALKVTISADSRSNSLIVAGAPEGFALLKSLTDQLDAAAPALAGTVQFIPLKFANAPTTAASLTNLFTQRYAAARTPDQQRAKPVILADLRVNALLVAADADDTKIITQLLEKLDVEMKNPSVLLTVIPLKFNDVGVVGPMLQTHFAARLTSNTIPGQQALPQDRVDVATDPLSNSLVVSANKDNLELIKGLLEKIDAEPAAIQGAVRLYALKNADAQRVATMLQNLITQGLYKPGAASAKTNAILVAREKVAIQTDIRTNTLIISASDDNFTILEKIIKEVDTADDFATLGDIRIYVLKNANASRLAPILTQVFTAKRTAEQAVTGGTATRSLQVSVFADARTNSLLVTGSRESFNAIEEMIKRLDGEDVLAASEFQVFYLKKATATLLQPILTQLFSQRPSRDGTTKDPVAIIADARTNSILMAATPEDMKLAQSLINRLDSEPDRRGTFEKPFPLVKADATAVKTMLDNLNKTTTTGTGAAAASPVLVSVDERTNTVWIQAGEGDMARMAEIIKQVDTDTVPKVTEVRVFPLKNADATELAQILNDTINKKPTALTTTSPNRQSLITFVSHTPEGQKLISSGLQEGILISADKRANALVVSAPTENMGLLDSLINSLDSVLPRAAEIRVIALQNADARQTATMLLQLFRVQTGTTTTGGGAGGGTQKSSVDYTLKSPDGGGADMTVRTGTAEEATLSITVDVRTNSLLMGGTKRYVDMAEKVALDLDANTASERITQVFRPRNAQATAIQTAVNTFLTQERTLLTQAMGSTGTGTSTAPYILDRQVAIVAESTTNTLLLSASPRYFDVVAQLIEELDQAPPQVLIQVLLAEVQLGDTNDLGIDWNFHHTWNDRTLVAGSNAGTRGLFSTTTSGGASVSATPLGFSIAATGGDIDMFMRALESTSHVEILSRPQILATDNQAAEINIGQRVPFITNSQLTDNGTNNVTVQYQQVGIILDVTPSIHPDGSVKMIIKPEVSSLSNSNVTISSGVQAVIVNNRSATTTVTVQDGHTVILGGLITTSDQKTEDKVPFFGDLPLLGPLFRSTHIDKKRSELLIILTPTVMRNVADSDAETRAQTRRLNLLRQMKHDAMQKDIFKPLDGADVEKTPSAEKAIPTPPVEVKP